MRKTFTFKIPDEPYVNTTANGHTVEITYTGPRYLCLCVNSASKMVRNVETRGETVESLRFDDQIEEGHFFVVLDASVNPLEAAYLTHAYTHGPVTDHSETVTDADGTETTYDYAFADEGIMGQVLYGESLKYVEDGVYSGPEYRLHANTREETLRTYAVLADQIEASLANPDNGYTEAERTKLTGHAEWLRDIPRLYANVKHWKIPFKTNIPAVL